MPVSYRIDADLRRVIATVTGIVTIEEMLDALLAVTDDPTYEPGFDIYSDHREIEQSLGTGQVMQLAGHLERLAAKVAGARWAIVTTAPASYGMMRLFSVHAEQIPMSVSVFRETAEAEEWLAPQSTPRESSRPDL